MTIKELIDQLISSPNQIIPIKNTPKQIIGFSEFKTINYGDESYFKITFEDHSSLCLIPSQNQVLYSDQPPTKFDIADEEVGKKDQIIFQNKKYLLDNKDDYQYVVRLIKGNPETIEGEVRFSDYIPEDGSKEVLSLGWVVRTGQRADVYSKTINIQDIKL